MYIVHGPLHLATIIPVISSSNNIVITTITTNSFVMSTVTSLKLGPRTVPTVQRLQGPCFNSNAPLSGASQPSHEVKQGKVSEGLGVEVEEVQIVLATHLPDVVCPTHLPSSPWDSLYVPRSGYRVEACFHNAW